MINPLNLYNLLTLGSFQTYFQQLDTFSFQPACSVKESGKDQLGQAMLILLQTDPVTPPDFIYLQISLDEHTSDNQVDVFKTEKEARSHFKKMKHKQATLSCQI